ncbi:MAG TPA: homoserine kinase [Candidatus Acidoferrales bacterium]|nr:homoserine kinase [Candidatus Acidoferrales bacterium]
MPRTPKRSSAAQTISLKLPATSANLGPAFDAAAVALKMPLYIRARRAADFSIDAQGRDQNICERLEGNLILDTYRSILAAEGRRVIPLALQLKNEIPIGKGLGSSAAARLAGIALANHFGNLRWQDAAILAAATRLEGHGDNAAACWNGGLNVIVKNLGDGSDYLVASQLNVRAKWKLIAAIAPAPLPTEKARRMLPESYSRADAVANVQHAMLLAHAFASGNPQLLREALHDRFHEPYRASLCPLLEPLRALAGKSGIAGAVLSGAGPSVLVILDPRAPVAPATRTIDAALRSNGLNAELVVTGIEARGARESCR